MLTIAYYFLQVVLCSGMMMGYYWLVLRNKRFHQYNRFYLLAAALLSWIVPLIKITWSQPVVISEQPQVMQFLSVVAYNNSQIEQTISAQPVSEWSWDLLVTGIYFCVAAILLFGMIRAFTRLYRLLRDHSCKSVGDVYLILTQAKGTPFSFFRYIFWNEEIDIRSEAGKQILQHELTHVQQKHSFDKLFIQVVLIGGWFNPFFWLLRKEMDMIHEFIADKKAVNNGDTASLAQMLLTAAYPQQQFALTHPFFFSPIKRRLQMLTNTKNPRYSYIRRLVVLPLLAIVIVLFAFRSKDRRENGELSVATVMENVAADQKQFLNSFLQGIGNFFETNNTENNEIHSIFYNGRPLTVPRSFRLKDLGYMVVTHLDKDHLNLTPALAVSANVTDPLYVIDGVKQTGKAALETLNPDDIDMIQIWKGADALARYGEAGKEGVIEITTKSFAATKKSTDGFNGLLYEGVVKDPIGNTAKNRVVYVKVRIYQGETEKAPVWEEIHVVLSNENGAINFTLGKDARPGSRPEGEIQKLDWSHGPYFVNLAMAVAPSIQALWWKEQDNYTDAGTTKMMSIPFPAIAFRSTFERVYPRIHGKDITIPPNTTGVISVDFVPAAKGDVVYISPKEDPLGKWSVYNAWVDADGVIKVRFANYTDKPVSVYRDNYIIGLGKFNGPPSGGWAVKYTEALIIVDGEVYRDGLNTIDMNEVRSVNIYKDPKSLESYGPEGKNGVIVITTKSQNGSFRLKTPEEKNTNPFSITDSLGTVKWQTLPVNPPSKKYPDTLVWVNGSKINATTIPANTQVQTDRGTLRATTVNGIEIAPPQPRISVKGFALDNSPATIAIKKQNPDVKYVVWRDKTHISIQLKDGTEETYDISKPDSKKRAEAKYGKLPEVPEKVANAQGANNLQLSVPGTIIGGTFSSTLATNTIKHDEVTVVGYGTSKPVKEVTVMGYRTRKPTEPAEFPGGLSEWTKYLERNLDKDVPRKKGAPPGKYTVDLLFDISEDGTISNIRYQNDPGYGTAIEATYLLIKSPKWLPARKDGKNISCTYKQSVTFVITDSMAAIDRPKRKEYYVFGWSRPMHEGVSDKQELLFTGIKKFLWTDTDDPDIRTKTKEWQAVVKGMCADKSGCTSDFNLHPTYEYAQKSMDQIKSRFANTDKYSIKTVAFN